MEISVKKEQVQWRSHRRSFVELGMLAASGRRQASRFRWPNLMTAVPLSCIVNRQIGVGYSKNVIVFNPLLTGHVMPRMRSGRVRTFNGNQWETL